VESCNKIDDDCDGEIDEDWPTLRQTCGQGICTGLFVCSEDGKIAECDGAPPESEICDGKDNDCNGQVDETGCRGGWDSLGNCNNFIQDGDEEGIDCGGSCPTQCSGVPAEQVPAGSWMIVFAILVAVIVAVGLLMVFLK